MPLCHQRFRAQPFGFAGQHRRAVKRSLVDFRLQPEAVIKVSIANGRTLDIESHPALRLIPRNTRTAS